MDLKNIPEELQKLNQWVCATDKSKAPMRSFSPYAASSTNPDTWGSFTQAVNAVADKKYEYIGFVFNDNGYVGIDIDKGFDDEGFLSPLAVDIIRNCKSYTEKSKSGRGFHIIVKGDLPFKGKNNLNGVEIYKAARYFITTGDVVMYKDIIENQEAIDYVVSKYFPEVRSSHSHTQGSKLYNPVWPRISEKIPLIPSYPVIPQGARNVSLTSLAGNLHTLGYDKTFILDALDRCNKVACQPPLSRNEISSICRSVMRYAR